MNRDDTGGPDDASDDTGGPDDASDDLARDGAERDDATRDGTAQDGTEVAAGETEHTDTEHSETEHTDTEHTDSERTGGRRRGLVIGAAAVATVLVAGAAAGFVLLRDSGSDALPVAMSSTEPTGTSTPSTVDVESVQAAATLTPTPSPTPSPRAATPGPQAADVPAPFVTSVAAGTVVAAGDVVSPKGSIRYHYRVVANGDDTYSAEYSGYTSTLPVPVSVTLIDIAPSVGDGITAVGPGDTLLGGPTSTATSATTSLGGTSQPSYLGTIVTYSSSVDPAVPVEIGNGKVLAVQPVAWNVPVRQTNIAPVDGGRVAFAEGTVTATTAAGAPRRYLVAPGDSTALVAQRFGISVAALIHLNQGLQVLDAEQHLYEGTTLNLDPDDV